MGLGRSQKLLQVYIWIDPTKMCINYVHYLHQKSSIGVTYGLFYALMLMLLTKFLPNSINSGINFINCDAKSVPNNNIMHICPKQYQNVNFLHHCRKMMQIRCQKGAGTKMHKQFDEDRYIDRPMKKDRQKYTQINRIINRQIEVKIDRQKHKQIDRSINRQIEV